MARAVSFTVKAGPHTRTHCPVSVCGIVGSDESPVALKDLQSGKLVPCQEAYTRTGTELVWLADGVKAMSAKKYTEVRKAGRTRGVEIVDNPKTGCADIFIGGSLFTSYHYANKWVRPFLHPVIGPKGVHVTRDWPIERPAPKDKHDHRHHRSIWVAYGECDEVDNWLETKGHGWQRHQGFKELTSGPVFGQIVAQIEWCAGSGEKQFEETRTLRFYATPPDFRLFDLTVSFHMGEKTVTFRDTKEGGLISVRVATALDVDRGGRIENGYGGIDEAETWGKRAPWCDYSGTINGLPVGIAVLDHEENPRYPTWWHVRNYGLMTANCFAWSYYRPGSGLRGDMVFEKGSTTTWKYRVYIHRGDARQGQVADRFHDFNAPPLVTVA